jgi:hypothetical protein
MNTQSIKANRVSSVDEVKNPGDFAWSSDFKTMFLLLPGEKGSAAAIRITQSCADENNRPRWIWDGNIENPSLMPSIHAPGEWHGYLQNGMFQSC